LIVWGGGDRKSGSSPKKQKKGSTKKTKSDVIPEDKEEDAADVGGRKSQKGQKERSPQSFGSEGKVVQEETLNHAGGEIRSSLRAEYQEMREGDSTSTYESHRKGREGINEKVGES